MERAKLLTYLQELFYDYDTSMVTTEGSALYADVIAPLIEKFGDDVYSGNAEQFIRDILSSEFPDVDFSELSAYADIVVTPFKAVIEPLRRELLRLKMAQSLYYKDYMTDEEIEGLTSIFQVIRKSGSKATVKVRVYFRAPRVVEINYGASAYTGAGLSFSPVDYYKFTPEQVAQNREGEYYYVDATFDAAEEGTGYNIGPKGIVGVSGVTGAVWASNPASATAGEDRETIDQYVDRLTTWVSEHAPVTESGITAAVMELFPAITDISVVGNGDALMYRDIITFTATTESTLAVGRGAGVLSGWTPPGLHAIPYAYKVTASFASLLPPTVLDEYTPTSLVISGYEFEIVSISGSSAYLDSYIPAQCLYGTNGDTTPYYTVENGVVIPHRIGLIAPGSGLEVADEDDVLLIYSGAVYVPIDILAVATVAGEPMLILKDPIVPVRMSTTGLSMADTEYHVRSYDNDGVHIMFTASVGGTKVSFVSSPSVEVGDRIVVYKSTAPANTYEYSVSYVGTTYLWLTKIDVTNPPFAPNFTYVPASPVAAVYPATLQIEKDPTDPHFDATVTAGDYFHDITADKYGIVAVADEDTITLEEWDAGYASGHIYEIFGKTVSTEYQVQDWVVYRREAGNYSDDLSGVSNYEWVLLTDPGDLLAIPPTSIYWQARRPALASDFSITAALPDGTSEVASGDTIHLGGCTDVYMKTSEEASVAYLDAVRDQSPLATGVGNWAASSDVITVTGISIDQDIAEEYGVYDGTFLTLAAYITVEIGDTDPRTLYRVLVLDTTGGGMTLRLSEEITDAGINEPVTVYVDHKLDLLSAKYVKHADNDARIGFSKYVLLDSPAPSTVIGGETFEITSGVGKGVYEVESVQSGGSTLVMTSSVAGFAVDVPYEIYTEDAGVIRPVSTIDYVELQSSGSSTAVNVYYRDPVACRAMGDSRTDGPDTIIPPEEGMDITGYMGSVASVVGENLGMFAWSGNVDTIGVKIGDILILHGILNNYSARIMSADYDSTDEVSYIVYSTYGYGVVDEDNVIFEIHASQIAKIRMYYEHPTSVQVGYWYPGMSTLFSYGSYTYSAHDEARSSITSDPTYTELVIDVTGGPTNRIDTISTTADFQTMDLKIGDIVVLQYTAVIGSSITDNVSVAGKSIVLTIAGVSKTYFFSGTNPMTLNDADGVSGQIEDAFGIEVEIRATLVPNFYRVFLISTKTISVVGGTSLSDLGLIAGATNDTLDEEHKGNHTIVALDRDTIYVDTVFTTAVSGDNSMIATFLRTGTIKMTREEMEENTEFGFYYVDVEVQSMQDATGSFLPDNTYLTVGGYYQAIGFSLLTQKEFSFGPSEDPELYVTPWTEDASGNYLVTAKYSLAVHYSQAPVVDSVQTVLSSDTTRATADNLMAKQKPVLKVGVGPLTYSGNAEDIVGPAQEKVYKCVNERVKAGLDVTLADVVGSLTSLGITYGSDVTLLWYYEDLERKRHLRFGDTISVDSTFTVTVPTEMIVFSEE